MKKRIGVFAPLFLFCILIMCLFFCDTFSVQAAESSSAAETETEIVGMPLSDIALSDGIYTISTKIDENEVLDISGGSWKSGANLQIWRANGTSAQKFVIRGEGGGIYSIFPYGSGHALDISGAGRTNGTNVEQYFRNGTDAQRFYIRDAGGGYAILSPLCSELVMDVAGGSGNSGTNVQTYSYNGTDAQLFRFTPAEGSRLSSGTYLIHTRLDDRKVLTVASGSIADGGNIEIRQESFSDAQYFTLTDLGSGTFRISPVCSALSMDVSGGAAVSWANVQQSTAGGNASQSWTVTDDGSGFYKIASDAGNDMTLDVEAAGTADGTNVQIYASNNSAAQRFSFEKIDADRNFPNGCYIFGSALDPDKVLDIFGASKNTGANLQLYTSNDTNAQKFFLSYQGEGWYSVQNVNSGKVFDVENGSSNDGANVRQYDANGTAAQEWRFSAADTDTADPAGRAVYFTIFSGVSPEKVLDVSGGSSLNGTNVQIFSSNGTKAQKWNIMPAVPSQSPRKAKRLIAIDAGHQLHSDTGTEPMGPGSSVYKQKVASGTYGKWSGLNEYELDLEAALKLRDELIRRGYEVYMIRTTNDVDISNAERAKMAAAAGADIFIRIHANGSLDASDSGALTIVPSLSNPYLSASLIADSRRLSYAVVNAECAATGLGNWGVMTADDMTGINWSSVPVTIVEMGFMTNRTDDLYMAGESGQSAIANGIADGIDQYFS